MKLYKPGDICPFCGQVIKTTDVQKLYILSIAAEASARSVGREPEKYIPKLKCSINACRRRKDNVCCAACDMYSDCDTPCLNSPLRCGCVKA